MYKIALFLVCLLIINGCSQINNQSGNYYPAEDSYVEQSVEIREIKRVAEEQRALIQSNSTDFDALLKNVRKVSVIADDQSNRCIKLFQTRSYLSCLAVFRTLNLETAEIEVLTADYLAQNGKTELAMELYRIVKTSYVGGTYMPYVRRAERGLIATGQR